MANYLSGFSGFSVTDQKAAQDFYSTILGLEVKDTGMGLQLLLPGGGKVFIYEKPDHAPASFTILNLVVEDIDATVDELGAKGVMFEHYDMPGIKQDEKGVARGKAVNMGPDIAWFKDPADNIVAVLSN